MGFTRLKSFKASISLELFGAFPFTIFALPPDKIKTGISSKHAILLLNSDWFF